MPTFSGQTFLVTGASGGVGLQTVQLARLDGARVCLTGRNRERLARLAADLPNGSAHCYPADLALEEETRDLVRQVVDQNQHLHGVVHCAAIIRLGSIAEASLGDFDLQYRINTRAPFQLSQLLLPILTVNRGQVVFINSSAARTVPAAVTQYGATKSALRAVADGLRQECNRAGVRVCSLFLGSIATEMQAEVRAQQGREYHPEELIQPDDVAQIVNAILALPRTAEVTDVVMRPTIKS